MNPHNPQKQPPKRSDSRGTAGSLPEESKAAEAATVAWMLTSLATLVAEVVALIVWVVVEFVLEGPVAGQIRAIPSLLLFTALVSGVLGLILLPVVKRVRQTAPPPGIVLAAVLICGLPPVALIGMALLV